MKRTFAFATLAAMVVLLTSAASAEVVSVTITVLDSDSNPISGATAKWNTGSWHYIPGSTDASGQLTFDVTEPYNTVVVSYHQTSASQTMAEVQDAGNNPVFQTVDARIRLIDCAGNGLAGGIVEQGQGSWIPIGTTQADGYLSPKWEVFAGGPYQYRMSINHSSQTMMMSVDGVTDNIFQTGSIDFGSQTAHWASGSHYHFTGLVELLPRTYQMDIGGVDFDFTISAGDCIAARLLTLLDEDGNGVAGGQATPATGGSWNAAVPGETDANGHLFAMLPSGFTKIRMTVNQTSQQQMKAQLEANSYTWQTGTATINVNDHAGAGLAGVVIDQGGGFWDTNKATTDASGVVTIPVFAGSAKFRAKWNKTSQTIVQAVPSTFDFQTGSVHDTTETCIKWAAGSWNAFVQDMEVFPGSYKFVFPAPTGTQTIAILAGQVNDIP